MNGFVKKILKMIIPEKYHREVFPKTIVKQKLTGKVLSGPFRGLLLGTITTHFPKMLGIYELELHEIVNALIDKKFRLILNIGAAEGYYACGFALKSRDSKIIAFEAEPTLRSFLGEVAQQNNISDNIEIHGFCGIESFQQLVKNKKHELIIMDIEGGEIELLNVNKIPELKYQYILVELHDHVNSTITETIRSRFKETHCINEIWSKQREMIDFPFKINPLLCSYNKQGFVDILDERRTGKQNWFMMIPKTKKLVLKED